MIDRELADNEIVGVVRYADIDGALAYLPPDDPGPPLRMSGG